MRRLRIPPMIVNFPVLFPTFRDLRGQMACWWHDSHQWELQEREHGGYKTWRCKRCRNEVTVFGAEGRILNLKDHGFKRVLVSYVDDPLAR